MKSVHPMGAQGMDTGMNQLENAREAEISKRQERGRTGNFQIRHGRGEHPFFQRFAVRSSSFLQHYVEIHALFTDESNTCTCRDWSTSGLETCKHIEAVLNHLRNLNASAFTWTSQKTPYLEDAVFAHIHEGRPCLRLRMSAELQKTKSFSFAANYGAIIDGSRCILPDPARFEEFLQQALDNRIQVCESALLLVDEIRKKHLCSAGNPELFVSGTEGPLARPLKPHQILSVQHLLSYPAAVIAEPAGSGKRVSALAAAVQIRRAAPPAPVVILCDAAWMAQWKRLIQVFDSNPVYLFGEPKGRNGAFEQKYQYYIASLQTLRRDANWIRKISPHVLIIDEFWMLKNWRGMISSLLKSLSAPHIFWLTSKSLSGDDEVLFQLAQCMFPEEVGPLWRRRAEGRGVQLGDAIMQRVSERILSRPVEQVQEVRRPKLRVMVGMSSRQAAIANEELSKLVALASANYAWSSRDVVQVVEKIQQIRLGMSVPAFLGAPRESRSIKLDTLARVVAMEAQQGRRLLLFSHWPELGALVQETIRRHGVRVRLLQNRQDVDDLDAAKYPVALAFDTFLDFRLPGVDVMVNLDLPWEKSLYNDRRAVCDIDEHRVLVEYNFVVTNSVEDRGLVAMETLPHLLRGFDGPDADPSRIDPMNLRTLVRKLAGRREERMASSSQSSVKVERVSSRERKVVSRKGLQEIERPSTTRGRGILSSTQVDRFSASSVQMARRGRVYAAGETLTEFENGILLMHFEVDPQLETAVFASVIEARSRRYMGWTAPHFPVLAQLAASAQAIVGSCSVGQFSNLLQAAFGPLAGQARIVNLQDIVEGVTQERVDLRNLLESTCGRKVLWDAMEVRRLAQGERWHDLLELGQSELRMIWELLNYMVRENRFFCRIDNERQSFGVAIQNFLPETLHEMLLRTPSI